MSRELSWVLSCVVRFCIVFILCVVMGFVILCIIVCCLGFYVFAYVLCLEFCVLDFVLCVSCVVLGFVVLCALCLQFCAVDFCALDFYYYFCTSYVLLLGFCVVYILFVVEWARSEPPWGLSSLKFRRTGRLAVCSEQILCDTRGHVQLGGAVQSMTFRAPLVLLELVTRSGSAASLCSVLFLTE